MAKAHNLSPGGLQSTGPNPEEWLLPSALISSFKQKAPCFLEALQWATGLVLQQVIGERWGF